LCRIAVVATLAAALAWGARSQATAAEADADAKQPLLDAAIAYAEAFNSNDMEALAAQWAEHAELFEADQQLVGRDAIMEAIAASRARLPKAQMTIEIDDIHFIAASLARISGRLTMEAVKDGPRISSEFTSLRVLESGQWLLAESTVLTAPQASL
jgi:ketosteroid isomerase-like protein